MLIRCAQKAPKAHCPWAYARMKNQAGTWAGVEQNVLFEFTISSPPPPNWSHKIRAAMGIYTIQIMIADAILFISQET